MKILNGKNLLFLAIIVLAAGIRFYNFPNRVTFWSEQARSLIVSANYIWQKPSLLGQPYFIREDVNSHILYSGPLFNYSLVPLLYVSSYNPVTITVFFALLNLVTGLVIYLTVKKMFNRATATASCLLFLFNDWMVYHSLFIWSYNYLPLVGILTLYFVWNYFKKPKLRGTFILGLLCGLGVSLQFLFLPLAFIVFIFIFVKSKRKIQSPLFFVLGALLGNLPMVIFDLRHHFYESRTLLQYFLDTLFGKSNATFAYYYLLPLWPLFAIVGGILLFRLWKKSRFPAVLVVILYLFLNLNSKIINLNAPTGMPPGLKVSDIDSASKVIANDAVGEFNVAELLDFDKKAYVLRYYLQYKYGKNPLGEAEYPNLRLLYVLSQKGYNFDKSGVWEIYSGGNYNVKLLSEIGDGYAIYKLTK